MDQLYRRVFVSRRSIRDGAAVLLVTVVLVSLFGLFGDRFLGLVGLLVLTLGGMLVLAVNSLRAIPEMGSRGIVCCGVALSTTVLAWVTNWAALGHALPALVAYAIPAAGAAAIFQLARGSTPA